MAKVTHRKPRITKWQPDDLFIRVAYTQGNGECVEASFAHVGWLVPPLRPLRPFAVQQRTGYGSIFEPVNPQYDARRRALLGLPPGPQPAQSAAGGQQEQPQASQQQQQAQQAPR